MKALMEQVPLVSTSLKRAVAKKAKQKDAQSLSAVLAVIAQGSMANVVDTEKPEAAKQWFEFCGQMREAAAAVNAGIHAKEIQSEEEPRMDKLQKTCRGLPRRIPPEGEGEIGGLTNARSPLPPGDG